MITHATTAGWRFDANPQCTSRNGERLRQCETVDVGENWRDTFVWIRRAQRNLLRDDVARQHVHPGKLPRDANDGLVRRQPRMIKEVAVARAQLVLVECQNWQHDALVKRRPTP